MSAKRSALDIRQSTKPLVIVIATWLLVCLGSYFGFVRPKVEEYRALQSESDPQTQALQIREAEVKRLEKFVADVEQATGDLTRLRQEILATREERMVETQLELNRLCAQFKIDLESVSFGNEVLADEGIEKFEMVVPLEGGYNSLRSFLQAVEDSDNFLVVERVALGEGKDGGVLLQLNITLSTYFDLPAGFKELGTPRRRPRGRA